MHSRFVIIAFAATAASVACSNSTSNGIESVTAGEGLTGGGSGSSVTLSVNFGASGAATSVARADHEHASYLSTSALASGAEAGSSAFVARSDHLHDSRYAQFPVGSASVNSNEVQLRVSSTCSAGAPILAINADGTVFCDSPRPRATYTHWGYDTCASGDDLLYTGTAFGNPVTHTGGTTKPLCYKANDPGPAYNGSSHGSYLVPLALVYTGNDAASQVQGVNAANRSIPCAVCATVRVCYEVVGSQSCAPGWSAAYQGELAGGYFGYSGNLDSFCYELNNSAALVPGLLPNQVYAASTGTPSAMLTGYTGYTHTKCAVCCR